MKEAISPPAAEQPVAPPAPEQPQPDTDRPPVREDATAAHSFSVPLSLELATISVPLARLQALQQGAVLEVEAGDGTLPVRVLANGRLLAHGTLVSIGDGYGVLIGDRAEG